MAVLDNSNLPRQEIAEKLLGTTLLGALQAEARSNREWASVYRGFRPQFLTRAVLLRAATRFAAEDSLLYRLCSVFLDSLGIPKDSNLRRRFTYAAESPNIDEEIRTFCLGLFAVSSDKGQAQIFDEPHTTLITTADSYEGESHDESTTDEDTHTVLYVAAPLEDDSKKTAKKLHLIETQVQMEWQAPNDNVAEAQEAVTLFERAMVAFIQRQLQDFHGDAWFRRGCGKLRDRLRERAHQTGAVLPATLLGYAHIEELREIITMTENWPAFQNYFESKGILEKAFSEINSLRVTGMHPSQRDLYLVEQVSALSAMVKLLRPFHIETADRIDEIFNRTLIHTLEDSREASNSAAARILTNLGELSEADLIGRETEMTRLNEFWNDSYARVLSITGGGGVGKTALLDDFTAWLLKRESPLNESPDPEVIVYLTAKDNYLTFMRRPRRDRGFKTLQRIYQVTLETIYGDYPDDLSLEGLRNEVLQLARSTRILFALDNLESLSDVEVEAVGAFLDDLPPPSKAIITTRVNRRIGRRLQIEGLTLNDAKTLFLTLLAEHGIEPADGDGFLLEQLIVHTNGFPLAIVSSANAIINGHTLRDTFEKLRGRGSLDLLEFSFESSLQLLNTDDVQVLLYLALLKSATTRKSMLPFAHDEQRLDEVLQTLLDMSLVRRTSEDKKQVKFQIANSLLQDYVLKRAPEILSAQQFSLVRTRANVLPSQAESPSVSAEIEKAIESAKQTAKYSWAEAIQQMETTRQEWGDDPRLLAELGRLYFRMQDRTTARILLQKAITLGLESPDAYAYLGLVDYYDKLFVSALGFAESALTLRSNFPLAGQLAAQCLLAIVKRDALVLDQLAKKQRLEKAWDLLHKSIVTEVSPRDEALNRRTQEILSEVSELMERLGFNVGIPVS